jgi:hypothetical protein
MALESGIRPQRLEFVRETTTGVTPTNPDWELYSNSVQSVAPTATASINPRGNVGSPDIAGFTAGASHSIIIRDRATDDGTAGNGSYMYTVMTGAKINTVNYSGEPESGEPIMVNLSYLCESLRTYKVDSPLTAGPPTLTAISDDAADTMNLTWENDINSETETKALDGTTIITSTQTFQDLTAVWLASAPKGDITITDGTNTLMVIYGSDTYGGRPGEQGIPLTGSGTHATALTEEYEVLLGDTIERPAATAFMGGADISSFELNVENNLEATSTVLQIGKKIAEGPRTITVAATIFGERASYDSLLEHLQAKENNIVWTCTGGTITVGLAQMTEIGSISRETDQAVMTIDNTFQGQTLTIA